MIDNIKFNDEVTLQLESDTSSILLLRLHYAECYGFAMRDTIKEYYERAICHLDKDADINNIESELVKDFKEKGNEYVVAKIYFGCFLENMLDFIEYPGDWIGDIYDETGEIWKKYQFEV